MKKFVLPAILLLLISFQNSLFEYIKVFGVKPDIILVFIICMTLIKGNPFGTIAGIAGGMLEDIFFHGAFGINSIACMLTAFSIGIVERKIFKDNIFVPFIFVFLGTIIKEFIVYLFLYLSRNSTDIVWLLMNRIIVEAVYNSILAVLFYKYINKISNKYFNEETWRI